MLMRRERERRGGGDASFLFTAAPVLSTAPVLSHELSISKRRVWSGVAHLMTSFFSPF